MAKLLAIYTNGGHPQMCELRDVTPAGAFLTTEERWYPGTLVSMSLLHPRDEDQVLAQDADLTELTAKSDSVRMRARVVREESDGVAVEFVYLNRRERKIFDQFLSAAGNGGIMKRFRWFRAGSSGQALVEFALSFPFMLLLIANVVNFGGLFYATTTIANAARHGSQYLVLAGASVGMPAPPAASLVHDVIVKDTGALLNPASLVVRACREDKANPLTPKCTTFPTTGGSFPNPPLDTRLEGPLYVLGWVDVQYTYQPYIPIFTIPVLGIPLTTPPATLRSRSIMRMLQ